MRRTILVVDDEVATREILQIILEMEGFTVFTAEDGLDALDKITLQTPDLIVLDVMMPNMDGLALCKRLRAQPATASIAVIMLSGNSQEKAIAAGLNAGANAFLGKPIHTAALLAEIRQLLA